MSRDWFDPFGIRGSRLDPFAQSARQAAKTFAQALSGHQVRVEREPAVVMTVEEVHELELADAFDAFGAVPALGVPEVPLWRRFRARLAPVRIGDRELDRVEVEMVDIRMVGPVGPRLRVARVEASARLTREQLGAWVAELDVPWRLGLVEGRLEVTAARVARWVGVELRARASAGTLILEPGGVRVLGRRFALPGFLRRAVVRPAPWLPEHVEIHGIEVVGDELEVRGATTALEWPVDMATVLTELTATSTKTVLRISPLR